MKYERLAVTSAWEETNGPIGGIVLAALGLGALVIASVIAFGPPVIEGASGQCAAFESKLMRLARDPGKAVTLATIAGEEFILRLSDGEMAAAAMRAAGYPPAIACNLQYWFYTKTKEPA